MGTFDWLVEVYRAHPGSVFVCQTKADVKLLKDAGIDSESVKFFYNVEEWVDFERDFDAAIGARIHGSMVPIAAGLPVMVLPNDWRILEMVERMMLPYKLVLDAPLGYDAVELPSADNVKSLFRDFKFSGEAFDQNRAQIAREYVKALTASGVVPSKHMLRIAAR
jgi:hypothetical protein